MLTSGNVTPPHNDTRDVGPYNFVMLIWTDLYLRSSSTCNIAMYVIIYIK